MSRSVSPEMFGRRFKERARSDPWISDRIRRYFSRRFTVGTNAPSGQHTICLGDYWFECSFTKDLLCVWTGVASDYGPLILT
ncbi:hypothetical protein AVEN_40839-1 [Araneus ventricosus]|uniref:Uncharacterized protein n=1 Tax=Araneus ventricosus TaxID=182803 RepID=A0A4Y2CHI2_ARAVE|nr:hypothetical protein AVEN_40839-1 [Araneus ventricosus]